jgi:RNA polymerase sigma-70 factor (ECF subfamily)
MMTYVTSPAALGAREPAAEADAIERARNGDLVAFDHLVRARLPRVLRLALSILGQEADAADVVQDAFVLAWRELPRLRDVDRFDAWLSRIVVNACRDRQRRRWRASIREIPSHQLDPDTAPAPGSSGDEVESADTIRRAFARLNADQRSLLVLHHLEERPVAEIASVLRIPEGTAKWRLHRARQALERAMHLESR